MAVGCHNDLQQIQWLDVVNHPPALFDDLAGITFSGFQESNVRPSGFERSPEFERSRYACLDKRLATMLGEQIDQASR